MNTEKIASALKINEDRIYEALPAMAMIIEKSEVLDMVQSFDKLGNVEGAKIVIRIISRLKQYEEEFNDVIYQLFDVDASKMGSKEKIELLKQILVEKDIADFF